MRRTMTARDKGDPRGTTTGGGGGGGRSRAKARPHWGWVAIAEELVLDPDGVSITNVLLPLAMDERATLGWGGANQDYAHPQSAFSPSHRDMPCRNLNVDPVSSSHQA